jgi:hypothetical protein
MLKDAVGTAGLAVEIPAELDDATPVEEDATEVAMTEEAADVAMTEEAAEVVITEEEDKPQVPKADWHPVSQ